ncbi:MAG: hypothetical protein V4501_08265 [Pseudomonadota bacterium]
MIDENVIPPMIDPLGKYWRQPDSSLIGVDEANALMDETTFRGLLNYSTSIPSGVYPGKMWRRTEDGQRWLLCWYGLSGKGDGFCSINNREILIA